MIISWLMRSRLARWLGAALALALALAGVIWRERRDAAQDAITEAHAKGMRDALEGIERGNEAVRRNDGVDPDERLRRNDSHW